MYPDSLYFTSGENKTVTGLTQSNYSFQFDIHLIWKCSRGPDDLLMCDEHSNLGHVQVRRPVANQPHLHRQTEVPGQRQGTAQGDHSAVSLLLNSEVSFFISRDYTEQHFVSGNRIWGAHPENVSRYRGVGGQADVVEGDSQRQRETQRRILRELASYAFATAEREKWKEGLIGCAETSAALTDGLIDESWRAREDCVHRNWKQQHRPKPNTWWQGGRPTNRVYHAQEDIQFFYFITSSKPGSHLAALTLALLVGSLMDIQRTDSGILPGCWSSSETRNRCGLLRHIRQRLRTRGKNIFINLTESNTELFT